MQPRAESEEEISQALLGLITAYEKSDMEILQKGISRNVEIHINNLDIQGMGSFLNFYHPEHFTLSDFSVQTSGNVGWGYGTISRKNTVMHFSAVFRERKRHEWQLVHLHLTDACL